MKSQWVDFVAVKQAVTMQMVIDKYGIVLRRSGQELRGKCPIHGGKGTDTLHVNTHKNVFKCFSCGAKGNVLDFVAALERVTTREAALKLKDWFTVLDAGPTQRREAAPEPAPKQGAGESSEPNKPLGFTLKGIDHAHPYLAERGIDVETARYFGVGFFRGKGSMTGRVVIPIEDEAGELVAYAGRSIDGTEPKYRLPAGFKKSQVVYNVRRAVEEGSGDLVVVVEGYFDCMKVTQAAYPCAALMGNTMSEQQEAQLAAYFTKIVVMLDGDNAGRTAAPPIAGRLARHAVVRIIDVGDDRQPDQLSTEELQELLHSVF